MHFDLLSSEGQDIKHLRPCLHRKLQKELDLKRILKKYKIVVIHLHYYDGRNLLADIFVVENEEYKFLESFQSF
jgi:hypothetical protein